MTTMNLGNLATFRLVVQRGSFSAAADALGISQPAVSLQVRQLEQFLQTRLLERTGRGIKATAAGMAKATNSTVMAARTAQPWRGSPTMRPKVMHKAAGSTKIASIWSRLLRALGFS